MKIFLISILALPLLSACTTPATDHPTASNEHEEAVYQIGSNLPTHKAASNVQTISPEDAQNMQGYSQPRVKSN